MTAPAARRRRDLLALGAAAALLFLPGLAARDLWNPDEARYAEVAREMRQRGDWLVPHLNGEVYTQKPPLLFWSIALASYATGGVDELSARLPSALSAVAAVLLVWLLGDRLFGRRAAWLAAAAFSTCAKVLWQGRFGQIDMLLTALVAAAVWLWVRQEFPAKAAGAAKEVGHADARGAGQPALPYLFFFFTGLATLAKGPVGLLPPLLSILVYRVSTRGIVGMRRLRLGRGLLLWAAVVAAWLVPAGLAAGPEYLEQIVFKQNVTRYADPWHHHQPWYYYLTVLPGDFFPWSFLLPAAVVVGMREGWLRWRGWVEDRVKDGLGKEEGAVARASGGGGASGGGAAGGGAEDAGLPDAGVDLGGRVGSGSGFLFAVCWVVVTVVFFSLSPAKRTVYVLTMYPGLALMVGAALDRAAAAWPRERRWIVWSLGLLAILCVILVAAVPVAGPRREETEILGGATILWKLGGAVGLLAAGALGAWWPARRGKLVRAVAALAAGTGAFWLAASLLVVPAFDAFKSARPMSRVLLSSIGPGEPYGIYPRLDSTFLFYTGRFAVPLESEEALHAFAARPGRVWLLAQRDDLAKLRRPPDLVEVARDPDRRSGYVLLTRP